MCNHRFVEDTAGSTRFAGGDLIDDIQTTVLCARCGMDFDDWIDEMTIQAAESGADRESYFDLDDYIDRQFAKLEEVPF